MGGIPIIFDEVGIPPYARNYRRPVLSFFPAYRLIARNRSPALYVTP